MTEGGQQGSRASMSFIVGHRAGTSAWFVLVALHDVWAGILGPSHFNNVLGNLLLCFLLVMLSAQEGDFLLGRTIKTKKKILRHAKVLEHDAAGMPVALFLAYICWLVSTFSTSLVAWWGVMACFVLGELVYAVHAMVSKAIREGKKAARKAD
mmetsp:Transcript_65804/g.203821  ORF Transcript_65804/g.203821 Transcript_65804/m.203821 type:complete len:153 (+) Transcript_65804:62-520(+)